MMKSLFEVLSNGKPMNIKVVHQPVVKPVELQQIKDIVLIKLLTGGGRK